VLIKLFLLRHHQHGKECLLLQHRESCPTGWRAKRLLLPLHQSVHEPRIFVLQKQYSIQTPARRSHHQEMISVQSFGVMTTSDCDVMNERTRSTIRVLFTDKPLLSLKD
jgi:hypothetical protein